MVGYLPILVVIAAVLFSFTPNKKLKTFLFYFCAFFLVFFAALRFNSGWDYWSYKHIYDGYGRKALGLFEYEPLFSLTNILFNQFHFSYPAFLFCITAAAVLLKLNFIKKYSPFIAFSIIIYLANVFYMRDVGTIRQSLAMGVATFAFPHLIHRRFPQFLFWVVTAALFHMTVITLLLAYPLLAIKLTPKKAVFFLCLSLGMGFLLNMDAILTFIANNTDFLPPYIEGKIIQYSGLYEAKGISGGFLWLFCLNILAVMQLNSFQNASEEMKAFHALFFWGVCIYFSLNSYSYIAIRMVDIMLMSEFILIPQLFLNFKLPVEKFLFIVICVLFYSLKSSLTIQTVWFGTYKNLLFQGIF